MSEGGLTLLWSAFYLTVFHGWLTGEFCRVLRIDARWAAWAIRFKREVHPFLPFAILANLLIANATDDSGEGWVRGLNVAIAALGLAAWAVNRDDDDRWKRRRRKLAERVTARAGRLVVAPVR